MKNKEKSQDTTPERLKKIIEKHPEITPDVSGNRKFCRISLPYVLQEQEDGSYTALNRNYKPIGFRTDRWVDHRAYPIGFRFRRLSADTIRKLSIQEHAKGDIYLYDDNCVPTDGKRKMTAYLQRIAILMKMEVY